MNYTTYYNVSAYRVDISPYYPPPPRSDSSDQNPNVLQRRLTHWLVRKHRLDWNVHQPQPVLLLMYPSFPKNGIRVLSGEVVKFSKDFCSLPGIPGIVSILPAIHNPKEPKRHIHPRRKQHGTIIIL